MTSVNFMVQTIATNWITLFLVQYLSDAVMLSEILKAKQKLSVTFNSNKQDIIGWKFTN